jgi:hypothetical protein
VQPPGRYGALNIANQRVESFTEKPRGDGALINGGFFVLSPAVIDEIDGDAMPWESEPLQRLSAAGELMAYEHHGFWQPMDTLREKNLTVWADKAPGRVVTNDADRRQFAAYGFFSPAIPLKGVARTMAGPAGAQVTGLPCRRRHHQLRCRAIGAARRRTGDTGRREYPRPDP